MINLLYIGNNLQNNTSNSTSIQILGKLLQEENYQVYLVSSKTNKFVRLLDMLYSVIRYVNKVDMVLIDTYSTSNFYYAFLVSQLCRIFCIPYIPILRGGDLPQRLRQSPKLSSLVFKHAKCLIAPSLYMKVAFENYGYENVVCIPNTIQIKNYPYKKRNLNSIKLLWVRSFSKIYNPSLAIRVLKALQDDGIAVELCMVGPDTGDGSFAAVKKMAEGLQVRVEFTGKLTKTEWIRLAANYTVFINTTNFDNMPVSVIEAMALGLPIVSTNVGGMPYLIKNGVDGMLVPPEDTTSFVKAIKILINNPELSNAMAVKARQKVEQLDWDVIKHQWFNILK